MITPTPICLMIRHRLGQKISVTEYHPELTTLRQHLREMFTSKASLQEFKEWLESAGVNFESLTNDDKIKYRIDFDSKFLHAGTIQTSISPNTHELRNLSMKNILA